MSEPFLGEMKIISWNFAPKGWAFCNGQFLPINQNQALFSLLGTSYGGNGQTTFALPDLRGRASVHVGAGYTQGQAGGQEFHTLTLSEMPAHTHFLQGIAQQADQQGGAIPGDTKSLAQGIAATNPVSDVNLYGTGAPNVGMAANSTTTTGGSQPHENRQPFLVLNVIIALIGIFPSRN